MAVRTNILKLVNGEFVYMTAQDIENIKQNGIHEYWQDPSVTVDVVATNGNMDGMVDRRYSAGVSSVTNTGFANPQDVQPVDTTWDTLSENRGTESDDYLGLLEPRFFPMYVNADGDLQTMSQDDFYDTFIIPAYNDWRNAGGAGNYSRGQYEIQEDGAEADDSELEEASALPVFKNSIADANYFSTATIPLGSDEQRDEPVFQTTYKLYKRNTVAVSHPGSLYITLDGEIKELSAGSLAATFKRHFRVACLGINGRSELKYKIFNQADYDAYTAYKRILGTGMVDTDLSSQTQRNRQVGDNYYSQDVPSGVEETRETYYLCVYT